MATPKTRPCKQCLKNRAERFFTSARGRICSSCRKANRSKATHDRRVSETYGLSRGEWELLFEYQGGRCAICRESRRERLSTDHCHKTGWVRMLTCRRCNSQLLAKGARDRPDVLRRAAQMLEDPPAVALLGPRIHAEGGEGEMEIWRPVPGYDGWYDVSSLGRVRSWRGVGNNQKGEAPRRTEPLILKPGEVRGGYLSVGLSKSGTVRAFRVARLVLTTFRGEAPGLEARHLNGIRQDDRLSNLAWGTAVENAADRIRHGTQIHGEAQPHAKLTDEKVRQLRADWATGNYSAIELGEKYGLSGPSAWRAAKGDTWKHVPMEPQEGDSDAL